MTEHETIANLAEALKLIITKLSINNYDVIIREKKIVYLKEKEVVKLWEDSYNTTLKEIDVKSKKKDIVSKRQALCYWLYELCNTDWKQIGNSFSTPISYSSVKYSCSTYEGTYKIAKELSEAHKRMVKNIKNYTEIDAEGVGG